MGMSALTALFTQEECSKDTKRQKHTYIFDQIKYDIASDQKLETQIFEGELTAPLYEDGLSMRRDLEQQLVG